MAQSVKDVCQYHMADHETIGDLKQALAMMVSSQQEVKETLIQLVESFKNMDKIEKRIDKIEDSREKQGERRDKEIKELRAFMNRSLGWAAAAVMALGIGLRVVGMI